MASDVIVDTYESADPTSSPVLSSDNDEVNTSKARIYFGPIQPAEEKYARRSDFDQPTPVKRSTRMSAQRHLSVATRNSSEAAEEEDRESTDAFAAVTPDESVPGTPAISEDVEEPSSALATKIMRAWDNPSPPPSPPHEDPENELEDVPILNLENVDSVEEDMMTGTDEGGFTTPDPLSPAEAADTGPPEPQEDLISFDSFSATTVPMMTVITPSAPCTPERTHITPASGSVDDLLSQTPFQLRTGSTSSQSLQIDYTSNLQILSCQASPTMEEEEAQVDLALSSGIFDPLTPTTPQTSKLPSILFELAEPETRGSASEAATSTPLRRSSRPRKSASPFVASSPNPRSSRSPAPPDTQRQTSSDTLQAPKSPFLGPARKKGSRRKERETQGTAGNKTADGDELADGSPSQPIVIGSSPPPEFSELGEEGLASRMKTPTQNDKPHRLSSLSPTSHEVLTQLLSPRPASPPGPSEPFASTNADGSDTVQSTPRREAQQPPTTPQLAGLGIFMPDTTPSQPVRPTTPPGRTPARRIPIAEAIAQGTVSPQKGSNPFSQQKHAGAGAIAAPVFRARALDDPTRTPAKRVPMPLLQSPQKGASQLHPTSPLKPTAAASSVGTEGTKHTTVSKAGSAFFAKPPPHLAVARLSKPSSHLPFPIVSSKTTKPSTSTPESEGTPVVPGSAKPSTSTLRHPPARLESKIPRVGMKPYARTPAASSKIARSVPSSAVQKKPEPPEPTTSTTIARPLRIRKVVSKPVTVDSDDSDAPSVPGPGPKTIANRAAASSTAIPASLKRKRDLTDSHVSSPGTRPVVVIRKVVSGASSKNHERKTPTHATTSPRQPSPPGRASPARVQNHTQTAPAQKIQMRKVVNTRKPKAQPVGSVEHAAEPESEKVATSAASIHVDKIPDAPPPAEAHTSPPPPSPPTTSISVIDTPLPDTTLIVDVVVPAEPSSTSPPSELEPEPEPEPVSSGLRRTTRARRSTPASSASDAVGSAAAPRSRRKTILGPPDTSAFSGMSMLALKTLTNNNTARNQKQVAELETEVIVKEGKRPDSPTTKVRTVLEKQREDKAKGREERAARRAKRLAAKGEVDDGAEGSAMGDESVISERDIPEEPEVPFRHRRAPGDEEDYVTPEKPERPHKRGRFEDGVEEQDDKRVKWDRGLQTTVYIDDTPPRPRRPPKEDGVRKGCLAVSSKSVRLDTMGNVLDAEAPLPELVVEHIVVKKFVYEDDEAEAEVSVEPVAKATRSKSKKAKAS